MRVNDPLMDIYGNHGNTIVRGRTSYPRWKGFVGKEVVKWVQSS